MAPTDPSLARELALAALCDVRTARRFLAGGRVLGLTRVRLVRAARRLKVPLPSAPPTPPASPPPPEEPRR